VTASYCAAGTLRWGIFLYHHEIEQGVRGQFKYKPDIFLKGRDFRVKQDHFINSYVEDISNSYNVYPYVYLPHASIDHDQ